MGLIEKMNSQESLQNLKRVGENSAFIGAAAASSFGAVLFGKEMYGALRDQCGVLNHAAQCTAQQMQHLDLSTGAYVAATAAMAAMTVGLIKYVKKRF